MEQKLNASEARVNQSASNNKQDSKVRVVSFDKGFISKMREAVINGPSDDPIIVVKPAKT